MMNYREAPARAGAGEEFDIETVLSGHSGIVKGPRRRLKAALSDLVTGSSLALSARLRRLDREASAWPVRSVLVLSIYTADGGPRLASCLKELDRSRHKTTYLLGSLGEAITGLQRYTAEQGLSGGKFKNINGLLAHCDISEFDWVLLLDDDVKLPEKFLDRLIALSEHLDLKLAQPAQSASSHAAWPVCRRKRGTVARQTNFVETGPVTAFSREAAAVFLPFPNLDMGWGLDSYWSAVSIEKGWKIGVIDATCVVHRYRVTGSGYSYEDAVEEARTFLCRRPHVTRDEALRPVASYRSW